MHIAEIKVYELPPLDWVEFQCDERVNVFIGPNASGKSAILRAIKGFQTLALGESLRSTENDEDKVINRNEYVEGSAYIFMKIELKTSPDWPRDEARGAMWNEVPFLYVPATRINLPQAQHIFDPYFFAGAVEEPESDGHGDILQRLFDTESGIFDGRYVDLAIDRLRRGMVGNRIQQNGLMAALNRGFSCAKRICSEIMLGVRPRPYVETYETFTRTRNVHHGMGIGTTDNALDGEPLYAGDLSSGTQGVLLWVYALALKIGEHYGFENYWYGQEDKPIVLLIDEIENHLHPTWQRRVIPALLEHFPGLQIFATTHSPFVVAGLKAGQVHLLKRDENGVVTATTNTEDIVGWTADEILRTMMGVDDPTDKDTAEAARELRQLRNREPSSDPEEEKKRQERMQELRQLVDRDLLAGGPWRKQRELFEEQFAEALQEFQQSQELNQENG